MKPITVITFDPIRPSPVPPRRSETAFCSQWGYTLMETLVAVMLLSISLTIVMQQFSGALNAARLSEEYTRAVWHAREKMNELQISTPPPARYEGTFPDGQRWEAAIEAADPGAHAWPRDLFPMVLVIRVSWRHGVQNKNVILNTVLLSRRKVS